jgi:hypothetical protein
MSKLFVVGEQRTLADLAPALLRSRVSKKVRESALDALARANPGLDLDRLKPGTVVVVPAVEGLRSEVRDGDPVHRAVEEMVVQVRDGIETLVAAAEAAEEARAADRKNAQELLGSSMVERLSSQSEELKGNVESARATLKNDDGDARRQLASLHEAAQEWSAGLDELRSLLP